MFPLLTQGKSLYDLIDGKKIAYEIKEEIKNKITSLVKEGRNIPGLVTILVGDDPGSQIYVNNKGKLAKRSVLDLYRKN